MEGKGKRVCLKKKRGGMNEGEGFRENFIVEKGELWWGERGLLYEGVCKMYGKGKVRDSYRRGFGMGWMEFVGEKGFLVKGEEGKLEGVWKEEELGGLGGGMKVWGVGEEVRLLKEMGWDGIGRGEKMGGGEVVRVWDEMGLMMMIEGLDEWEIGKCEKG